MRVYVSGQSSGVSRPDESGSWTYFYQALRAHDLEVVDALSDADAFVAMNHQPQLSGQARSAGISPQRSVLVAWESPAIRPRNFHPSATRYYGFHIGFSPLWPAPFDGEVLNWPQGQNFVADQLLNLSEWRLRDRRAVLVCRNTASAISGSQYLLRREVLTRADESLLHLAGTAWPATLSGDVQVTLSAGARAVSQGRLPNFALLWRNLLNSPRRRGAPVEDKYDLLEDFQVALVIENSLDYVSEKLFDAIAAGCFPIYVGPSLETMGLDPDLALAVPPDPDLIRDAISRVSSRDVEMAAAAHQRFVREQLAVWSASTVFADLGMRVGRALTGGKHS